MTGWRLYAVLALVTASALVGWTIRGWRDAAPIASAQVARAEAERALSDLNAIVARREADLERTRADDEKEARELTDQLATKVSELQSSLARSERGRAEASAKLREELDNAPSGDARELGPAVLRFLERVRDEQTGATSDPAARGDPNGLSVPDNPSR